MGNLCSDGTQGPRLSEHQISVAEFISVCIYLSEECGKIIRQVSDSGDLKTVEKGSKDSPVTVADLRVQKTLEVCLKHIYPNLQVKGEESAESIANVAPAIDPTTITAPIKNFIRTSFLNQQQDARQNFIMKTLQEHYEHDEYSVSPFETFDVRESVVWIDPLDGTSDFVKGNLPAVTVLIGLAIKERSRIGIVHKPFSDEDQSVGVTTFGTAEHGVYRVPFDKEMSSAQRQVREPQYLAPFSQDDSDLTEEKIVRVAASLSHFSAQIQRILEHIKPVKIVRLGGAGNKVCNLALDNVDAYIHPSPGLMYWDLCAPESLIKGMGGKAVSLHYEPMLYKVQAPNYKIRGLVAAKTPPMFKLIDRRLASVLPSIRQAVKL